MRYVTEQEGTLTPRVGFTYFGQFIGHDLTHDLTPLAGPYLDAERTPNYRSAYLNVEQLYGGGPENSPWLYEGETAAETFKIGRTCGGSFARDLPIESGGMLIADDRNLDNLILRQLHVVFLKFHNEAVRQLRAELPSVIGMEGLRKGTLFERAQQLVQWHYQWIVRHDFLPRILHHSVWNYSNEILQSESNNDFSIPIEFSLAAYRFGHSMVRKAYGLNCRQKRVELSELMRLGHKPQLADDFVIEWGRFFDGLPSSGPVASSSYLDTSIALPLHELSQSVLRLCIKSEVSDTQMSLPVRTLLRGARAELPSGQEVAQALVKNGVIKPEDQLTSHQVMRETSNRSGRVLRDVGLDENTPLFYYVLKEAEILGLGRTLGPVGSYIVVRSILGALHSDPESYISEIGSRWQLPLWRFPSGSMSELNSLIKIIRLVGDERLLPDCDVKFRSLQPTFRISRRKVSRQLAVGA